MTADIPIRRRLPNRRPSETHVLIVGNVSVTVTIGFDPHDGKVREVFINGGKVGTEIDGILADIAVILSVSLQHDLDAATLSRSVARLPLAPLTPADLAEAAGPRRTAPASVVGAVLDLLRELAADD